MATASARDKFLELLGAALSDETLVKLTLGAPHGADTTLRNVFVRRVALRAGPRLQFVYRHATRDVTKNLMPDDALARIKELLDSDFRSAHLFTTEMSAELEIRKGKARLRVGKAAHAAADSSHDRAKQRFIDPQAPWLRALGVAAADGIIRNEMGDKFRQINKFVEILSHLTADWQSRPTTERRLHLVDMGCGKGYLTFAAYDWLQHNGWSDAEVVGIEARTELVGLCNRVARECGFDGLQFEAGTIDSFHLETLLTPPLSPRDARGEGVRRTGEGHAVDILVALHACDTATDDAIAKGVEAGASLILVAPCCHKELRPQLRAPPALAGALKHGILRERQAEFVTDALRAALLEWAGYETKVFEFISTEHTARNLMIAAAKRVRAGNREDPARQARELAAFYGIEKQRLAEKLDFPLLPP